MIDDEVARRSLYEFMRQAWPIVEPGTPFVDGWHLDAIAAHLEAVSAGHIRHLIVNIPPRHAKSLLVAVFWPCWEWIAHPERRWLFASYAASLSIRDSLKCRRIITSSWYQERWGDRFTLTNDQNAKIKFENNKTGYRLATSVGGAVTGEGGDRVIVDDPHNMLEAESDVEREKVLTWWDEAMSTRLNDPKTGARVIVMQRLHERDLTGHALEAGGYDHLCLPAEYEQTVRVTSLGFVDPRTIEGALLWPERVGPAEIDRFKRDLGPYGYAGQMQQQPAPRTGGLFQRSWFQTEDAAPVSFAAAVRYWDKAGALPGKGDWTVGVLMGRTHDGYYWLIDVARGQWPADERNRVILETAKRDRIRGYTVKTWIEQPPGLAKESTDTVVRLLAGYPVEADPVHRDKVERAEPVSAQLRAGNVRMLTAEWNDAYLAVMCRFPTGAHDDDVDATSGAFNKLAIPVAVGAPAVAAHPRILPPGLTPAASPLVTPPSPAAQPRAGVGVPRIPGVGARPGQPQGQGPSQRRS